MAAEATGVRNTRQSKAARSSGGRRGLVLGGGGTLGAAWMIGALCALEEAYGWDVRDADVVLGTSAGSIVAALLALGARPCDLRDHQRGTQVACGPLCQITVDYDTWVGGALPPAPRPWIGSPKLLRGAALHPRRVPFQTVLTGLLPAGRGTLDGVRAVFGQLGVNGTWPRGSALRVVAVDYDGGDRVQFGAPGAPRTDLTSAVTASCALPAWFAPVSVDGRRFVDGGVWSDTNLDLLAAEGLEEIVVLAPTSARRLDHPRGVPARVERRLRRGATRRLLRETRLVRRTGTRVRLIVPGPEDLTVMGANLMDPLQRLSVLETSLRTTAASLAALTIGRAVPGAVTGPLSGGR